jgi:hypothetical protein
MESPFTTTMNEADSEIGAFQIIMDNLIIQQKTSHKTLVSFLTPWSKQALCGIQQGL